MKPEAADREEIWDAFRALVNMSPSEIERWLEQEESSEVGFTRKGESESVGRDSARKIVAIKRTKKAELSDSQWAHMRKVIGYIKRHGAQRPQGDVTATRWRYSLMNWGHDPKKKG